MGMNNTGSSKRKIQWRQGIATIFFLLIGAVCGFFMGKVIAGSFEAERPFFETVLTAIGVLLSMYAAILIQLIVHEAGHLVFGLLSGYRFSSFRIFSVIWVREDGKIRCKRLSIAGTGGQCLMNPPDMVDGKIPTMLYNLGGPLMNAVVGVVFFVLYFAFQATPVLSAVLLFFAVTGLAFAVMNGVPMHTGTVDNDGYNAFALSRSDEAMRAFWVQMKINGEVAKGVRLKDMPGEWFDVPSDEAMKNSMVAALGVFACNRLMDAARFEEADRLMQRLLTMDSGMVGLYRGLLTCDRMYCELVAKNRPDVLDGMRTEAQIKFMKQMKNYPSVLRTEYTCALLGERDAESALRWKEKFEKCAQSYPYPSDVQSERELMEFAERMA